MVRTSPARTRRALLVAVLAACALPASVLENDPDVAWGDGIDDVAVLDSIDGAASCESIFRP